MIYLELITKLKNIFPFENYISDHPHSDAYKTVFKISSEYLKENSTVIDIGSGPGDKTAIVAMQGHKCIAYDDMNDEWHKDSDNNNKIFKFFEKMKIQSLNPTYEKIESLDLSLDMIMSNDALEHLHESPKNTLLPMLYMLKDNGIVFITVPNAGNIKKRLSLLIGKTNLPPYESYYWYPGLWRGHIREYVYNDLKQLCIYLDLSIELLTGVDHMLEKVPKWLLPFYRMTTKLFPHWKDSWVLVARKKSNWSPLLTQE
jgi:SAM-dependent methyltransferase